MLPLTGDHLLEERQAEEVADATAFVLRVPDERLVPQLEVEVWTERGTGSTPELDVPLPPQCGCRHRILEPGLEPAGRESRAIPVEHGQAHVAPVADDVDELRVRPERVEGRNAPDVPRRLVADEAFALALAVQVEHAAHEIRVCDSLALRQE